MSTHFETAADPVVGQQDPTSQISGQLALILALVQSVCERLDGRVKSHYTVEEVADLTGRAPYTVRAWIKEGRLKAIRVPGTGPKGRLLVQQEELRRLVTQGQASQVPAYVVERPSFAGCLQD